MEEIVNRKEKNILLQGKLFLSKNGEFSFSVNVSSPDISEEIDASVSGMAKVKGSTLALSKLTGDLFIIPTNKKIIIIISATENKLIISDTDDINTRLIFIRKDIQQLIPLTKKHPNRMKTQVENSRKT